MARAGDGFLAHTSLYALYAYDINVKTVTVIKVHLFVSRRQGLFSRTLYIYDLDGEHHLDENGD